MTEWGNVEGVAYDRYGEADEGDPPPDLVKLARMAMRAKLPERTNVTSGPFTRRTGLKSAMAERQARDRRGGGR